MWSSERGCCDRIVLTIPRAEGFENVAQLVLAGVAARLNLTFEVIDDLGTALAALLERRGKEGELTVELEVGEDVVTATLGPFRGDALRGELERQDGGVGLRRVLETMVDGFGTVERDGGEWIELEKRVESAP
jgi:hypothetical protein